MAQEDRNQRPSGKTPVGKGRSGTSPKTSRVPTEAQRTAVGSGPKGSARQRQSVAPGSSGGNNRTQLIIWGAAIAVIVAVIVVGIVWNISNNKVENAGYGTAAKSTVTMDANGIITMSVGAPTASFDVYEDPLCPYCADFERKYGQQIAQAVDDGKVAVNYHLLNFLDQGSGSGDYSSRATGAMMCAATNIGSTPGAWASLHSKLYEDGVQPTENSVSDMTNEQLAQYVTGAATGAGLAPDAAPVTAAVSCVNSGAMLPTVTTAYNVSAATLTQLVGGVRSPVIVSNGALVDPGQTTWLSTITG